MAGASNQWRRQMTSSIWKLTASSLLALGLATTPALADCHGDWDVNQDTMYDQAEFQEGIGENGWFAGRDADGDGLLAQDEFSAGLYDTYDRDDDGLFSEEEREVGFGDTEAYSTWDGDADGMLSEDEFNAGFGESEMYGAWDADGDSMLSEEEYTTWVYNAYDADGTGYIEEAEVGLACDDYGEEGFWDF